MNRLHAQMALLDAATTLVGFAANWLLQSTLLIAAGLTVAWLMRRHGAAAQSAIYRTTLVAAIVCPLATSLLALVGVSGWSIEMPTAWAYEEISAPLPQEISLAPQQNSAPLADHSMLREPARSSANTVGNVGPLGPEPRHDLLVNRPLDAAAVSDIAGGNEPASAFSTAVRPTPSTVTVPVETWLFEVRAFGLAAVAVSLVWLAVSAVMLLRLGVAWRRLGELRRDAAPAEAAAQETCRELAKLLAVSIPELLRSPYFASPCLAGLLRPAVLLPEADSPGPVRDVLIHELAHLRRGDCLWKLLRHVAAAIFFYQSLLWILSRRLETSAEEVCDDYVVQLGGDREQYARQLVDIAELSAVPAGAAAVAMVSLRSILAKRVARIMDTSRSLSTRADSLLLAVVIAGGLAGTTMVGFVGLKPEASLANEETKVATEGDNDTAIGEAAKAKGRQEAPKANEQVAKSEAQPDETLSGRVLGADGKPVAGAKVYWLRSRVHDLRPRPPRLVATTGDDGRYRFTLPPDVPKDEPASWDYSDRIVIRASGHGFAITSPGQVRRDIDEPAVLPAAGDPIRGRLVDINGQPVAGARVRIRWFNDDGDERHFQKELQARGVENAVWQARVGFLLAVIEPAPLREALPSVTTDAEGRFELRDLGAKRLVQLLVEGEGIEATEILARNEPGEKIVIAPDRHERGRSHTVYPSEFLHAFGPSKPVEGRVLDLDTGEPIVDAVVRAFMVHGDRMNSSREREHFAARTDEAGRYRITGLPIGDGNRLVAFATGDVPYIPVGHAADTSPPARRFNETFVSSAAYGPKDVCSTHRPTGFSRARLATTTSATARWKKRSRVCATPISMASTGPTPTASSACRCCQAAASWRIAMTATPSIATRSTAFRAASAPNRSRGARIAAARVFPTEPHYLIPGNYERVAEVSPIDGQKTIRVDMPLFASEGVTVRAVDPEGKPMTQFQAYGANDRSGWKRIDGPEFEIEDLRPDERRKVFIFHRDRNLAGGGFVKHGANETVEIKLVEAGSVEGRLVDAGGEPINDASLFVQYEKLRSDDNSAIWAPHPQLRSMPTTIPVDKEGRFRLEGLIPGWSYHSNASAPRKLRGEVTDLVIGQPFENVRVPAGENEDLGDLVIGAEQPDEVSREVE